MRLLTALRLDAENRPSRPPRLAVVGSGGKTTAMFRLAREMLAAEIYPAVLLSATTHLGLDQAALADRHLVITGGDHLAALSATAGLPSGVTLLTGPAHGQRLSGLEGDLLEAVRRLAEQHGAPLLVEADGSRRLPLKAPADHEPPIPPWVDHVLVAAGLSGLGAPLDENTVFRHERFAALSGLPAGERITPHALARVLLDPLGGLKNIPPGARRVALLNQADTAGLQGAAHSMTSQLLPAYSIERPEAAQSMPAPLLPGYSAVLAARLNNEGPLEVLAAHERIAGVLLAAGGSTRLGRPKQLLDWKGQPFVRRVAQTALDAGLNPLVVVTGAHSAEIAAALDGLPYLLAHNPAWQDGQSSSLRAGLACLPVDVGAAVFLLCDQPQVNPPLLRALVERHAQGLPPVVGPLVDGRRSNPVLFDRRTFPALGELSGDTGGRALFSRYTPTWVDWHDSALLLDVDTEEDYRRLLERTA